MMTINNVSDSQATAPVTQRSLQQQQKTTEDNQNAVQTEANSPANTVNATEQTVQAAEQPNAVDATNTTPERESRQGQNVDEFV